MRFLNATSAAHRPESSCSTTFISNKKLQCLSFTASLHPKPTFRSSTSFHSTLKISCFITCLISDSTDNSLIGQIKTCLIIHPAGCDDAVLGCTHVEWLISPCFYFKRLETFTTTKHPSLLVSKIWLKSFNINCSFPMIDWRIGPVKTCLIDHPAVAITVFWDVPMWNDLSVAAFIWNFLEHLSQPSIPLFSLVKCDWNLSLSTAVSRWLIVWENPKALTLFSQTWFLMQIHFRLRWQNVNNVSNILLTFKHSIALRIGVAV